MKNQLVHNETFYDFITGKASTAIARRLHRNFKNNNIEITAEQWSVLFQLWNKEGLTQQEIANNTFKDKPSITRLLNNMEKLNLVVRIPHQSDKRTNLIYLTQKGKSLKKSSIEQADITLREALKDVNEEDIQICYNTLQKVFNNLK
jgi:DNA-binding MarR family transcriptional regulator